MKEYKVTAYCLAYNHEKYIRQALEGFVSQKTDFGFKVIVHDDASTDGTRAIIEEYAEKYPEIIFPIYQTENQYSKGVKIFLDIIAPKVDTEYLMVCEGDDYWTDENKVQMQYDFMQSHPECSLCVHNTEIVDNNSKPIGKKINPSNEDYDVSTEDIIAMGGGGLFHTTSCIYRVADRVNMPKEYLIKGVGDYPLALYLSSIGKVHYIGKTMSAYRTSVSGSWTDKLMKDKKRYVKHMNNMVEYLKKINEFTDGKNQDAFKKAIAKYRIFAMNVGSCPWRVLVDKDIREELKQMYPSTKKRTMFVLKSMAKNILWYVS